MGIPARFNFTGTILIPKTDAKRPFFKEMTGKNKKAMVSVNFGIKESDNNMAFVEGFDSIQDVIQSMNTENEKIEIKWANRLDEDVLKKIASFKKFTVDLGEDFGGRKEFLTQYDALVFLKDWLPKYEGKVCVIGQFAKEWYKDQYYDKFKFQNIYAVDKEQKNKLLLTFDFYYNKDSIDKSEQKENKKIYLNGFIEQYINKDEKNKFVPQQLIFNYSKFDFENNESHKKLFDYKMNYIDIKNKTMAHMLWDVRLIRGAEEVEFNESMLTPAQKQQVELDIHPLEYFKPRGSIVGEKINEYRLADPKLLGDFANGIIDSEMKMSEFEESIFVPTKDENLEEVMKKAEDKPETKTVVEKPDVDDSDLF
jgi:hypothetical protein